MNQDLRRYLVPAGIFVLGVALYAVLVLLGTAFGLSSDVAGWLAFGGLAAYALAIVVVVRTRRRNARPGGIR
jgi:hypothetical protein